MHGMSCPVTFDTGANMTAVPGRFITPMQFTGENIRVVLANMDTTSMREAVLLIEVDGKAQSLTVIALKDEAPEVLLGTDHEVTRELLNPKPIGPKSEVITQVEVCAITRAKSQAQKKECAKDMAADTWNGAKPNESFTSLVDPIPDKPAKSRPIPYQFTVGNGYREVKEVVVGPNTSPWGEERARVEEEERFEDEEEKFEDEEERFEDEVEEDSSVEVEAESLTGLEGEGVELSDQPLPALCKGMEEVRVLAQQQQDDASLREFRKKGKEQTNGYVYADGVLVHVKVADPGREWTRVVVPTPRRREVLDVGRRGLAGGHFSHNRMVGGLRQYFTWPVMRRDARRYCSSCPECQKAGRPLQPKVPMVETP